MSSPLLGINDKSPPKPQGVLKYGHMGPIFWFIYDDERWGMQNVMALVKLCIGSNPIVGFGNHFTPCYGKNKTNHLRKATFTLSSIFTKWKAMQSKLSWQFKCLLSFTKERLMQSNETHYDSIHLKICMCIWEKQSFIILILPSLSPNPMKYIMLQFSWILKFECLLEIQYRYCVCVIHMNLSLEYQNDQTLKPYI